MMNLEKYFKNPFMDDTITDDRMKSFSNDHLQRITVRNTNSQYDEILTATASTYEAFFGSITDEATRFAIQQARTKALDLFITNFKDAVRQKEGTIRGVFGKESPTYLEFFPGGLTEVSLLNKTTIDNFIKRLANAIMAHQAELGDALVTQFNIFETSYKSLRSNQLQQKGQVSDHKNQTNSTREQLASQLFLNLHILALEFAPTPEKGLSFFNQSLLQESRSAPKVVPPVA